MSCVVQISDTHFGTERPPVIEALVRLVHEQAPELVVLSGDITQRARRRQFAAAQAFMRRLGTAAQLVIPGNHDIPLFNLPGRLLAPYANHVRAFGSTLEPIFESARLLVLGLNTTRAWRHKNGEISDAQIERVAERLASATPGQVRMVAMHHPVVAITESDEANLVHGRAAALRRWAAAGVDLILSGHIHLPYFCSLEDRWPELSRCVWAVQAGTAVSSRIRGGIENSVNVIRCRTADKLRCCALERWDYEPASGAFCLVHHRELQLGLLPYAS